MKIFRDTEFENKIIKLIQKNWENTIRKEIHLSDLLASRKAYFSRILPKPPTIEEILYFLSGNAIEKELLLILKKKHGKVKKTNGITYTVDARLPKITEIKSRRRALPKEGDEEREFDYYIQQHSGYCALDGEKSGHLLVVSLAEKVDASNKTKPMLAAYKVKYSKDDMEVVLDGLVQIKEILELALTGDQMYIESLPPCPQWMCGKSIKTMDTKPKCLTCGREFETDYGADRHKNGKKTSDHEIEPATYTYTFEPMCKWYEECRNLFHE